MINHHIWIPINQPGFHGKEGTPGFFHGSYSGAYHHFPRCLWHVTEIGSLAKKETNIGKLYTQTKYCMLELALKTITLYFGKEWRFVPNGHLACNETLPYQDFITSRRHPWILLACADGDGVASDRRMPLGATQHRWVVVHRWYWQERRKHEQRGWFLKIARKVDLSEDMIFHVKQKMIASMFLEMYYIYIYIQNMKYVIHNQFYDMYTATHIFVFKYQKVIQ